MSDEQRIFSHDDRPSDHEPRLVSQKSTAHDALRRSCSAEQLAVLERWARSTTVPHRLVRRSRIVLTVLGGASIAEAARTLSVSRETVARWVARVVAAGPDSLERDRPGRGRKPGRDARLISRVQQALAQVPSGDRWSVRRLARVAGVSPASVQRIQRDLGHVRTVAAEQDKW